MTTLIEKTIETEAPVWKAVAYVSSPYRGDIFTNRQKAIEYGRKVIEMGFVPIVPHLYLPLLEDDDDCGLDMDLVLIEKCDIFILCGETITEGMQIELEYAEKLNMLTMRIM